jgi:Flp pilus assembly protein TadG
MPVLLGMVAMAVDLGSYASHRSALQHSADAIALAAVQELPDAAAAQSTAGEWAVRNNIDPGDMTVTVTGTGNGGTPKVTVVLARSHNFVFAKIFGVDDAQVGARAAATRSSYGGGGLIVPWAVTQDTIDASGNGALITMKYDSRGGANGNFGAIRLDGSDSDYYEQAIMYGSTSTVCSIWVSGCDDSDCPGASCAETAPECDGALCRPKTGNMTGPTRDGVDYRMDNTSAGCDSFAEAFTLSGGSYRLNAQCNPFNGSGTGSLRVIIIPIVDEFGNGSSDDLEIQSFALMYLEGYDNGKCQGNSCEVKGRFIKNNVTIPGLAAAYDPSSTLRTQRLTE